MSNPFFSWRGAILKSSLPPTTRHVLLTLACHMNDAGESCYPSIQLLCLETGLSNRAIITHLHDAADLGWIVVKKKGLTGQAWSRNSYELSWKAVNLTTEGDEPDDVKAVKEVHTSTSLSTSKSTTLENVGFDEFWNEYPKHPRKQGKSKCLELWKRKKFEARVKEILQHLEFSKELWQKGNNEYVPFPQSYLNKEGWDGWEAQTITRKDEFTDE